MNTSIEIGARCLAGPGGHWKPARIIRINEDLTYDLEFDQKEIDFMPHWYGITSDEISINDAALWPDVFAQINSNNATLDQKGFFAALRLLNYEFDIERGNVWWNVGLEKALGRTNDFPDRINSQESYALFCFLGISSKSCLEKLRKTSIPRYFKMYWNQTRMGGRSPNLISRAVTVDDSLEALGLTRAGIDKTATAALNSFENRHAVHLPKILKQILSRQGADMAVKMIHPNNPDVEAITAWRFLDDLPEQGRDGGFAIPIVTPMEGEWVAVFNENEDDARIYFRFERENGYGWLLAAPSSAFFLWDLAQTGLCWHSAEKRRGGPATKPTDIGLRIL